MLRRNDKNNLYISKASGGKNVTLGGNETSL